MSNNQDNDNREGRRRSRSATATIEKNVEEAVRPILGCTAIEKATENVEKLPNNNNNNNNHHQFPVGSYLHSWYTNSSPSTRTAEALGRILRDELLLTTSEVSDNAVVTLLRAILNAEMTSFENRNDNDNVATTNFCSVADIATRFLFGCSGIVGFRDTIDDTQKRHVSRYGCESIINNNINIPEEEDENRNPSFVPPSPHCSHFLSKWNEHASSLMIVGGSSGSGKSVMGVHLGKLWDPLSSQQVIKDQSQQVKVGSNIVVYLSKSDLYQWSEDANANLERVQERDEAVKHSIRETIKGLFLDQHKHFEDVKPLLPLIHQGRRRHFKHLVFVIDELGNAPVFVRGLASVAKDLAEEFHEKFFGREQQQNNDDTDTQLIFRVAFIACGTGLAVAKSKDGSNQNKIMSFLLDHFPLPLSHMFQTFRVSHVRSPSYPIYHQFLSRLLVPLPVPSFEAIELIAIDMLQNPRCAALFCLEILQMNANENHPSISPSGSKLNHLLQFPRDWCRFEMPSILLRVIGKYIRKNSLSSFRSPLRILLCSMAVAVFQLPALPRDISPKLCQLLQIPDHWSTPVDKDKDDKNRFHQLLSTNCGILVDQAFIYSSKEGNQHNSSAAHFVLPTTTKKPEGAAAEAADNNQSSFLYFPKSGRYFLSHASLAKIHFFLGINRRPYDENGLELSIGDFCFCVATCAPFYKNMKDDLISHSSIQQQFNNEDDLEMFINRENDPLYELKKSLIFGGEPVVFQYYQNESQLATNLDSDESSAGTTLLINRWNYFDEQMQGVSSGRRVVIMRTAHQEPFPADVIVAGRNRIVLIHVYNSKKKGDMTKAILQEEFAKMNFGSYQKQVIGKNGTVVSTTDFPTPGQRGFFDKLVAKCRFNDGGDEKSYVKVCAFIIITSSGGTSTCSRQGCETITADELGFVAIDSDAKVQRIAKQIVFDGYHRQCEHEGVYHNHPLFPAHPNKSVELDRDLSPRMLGELRMNY